MGPQLIRLAATVLLGAIAGAGCARARPPEPLPEPAAAADAAPIPMPAAATHSAAAYASARVGTAALERRDFAPDAYWEALLPIVEADPGRFRVAQIGTSVEGRPLRRIDFGAGAVPVLLWSQMHGNESTASRALADVLAFLRDRPDDPLAARIERELAVTVVPLVNPDGAARFQRPNAVGIDINRDARMLATPEARALKAVRDEIDARWGFNLHDQNIRTRLGASGRDVLIALLAPPPGPGETSPANLRARRMCSLLARALEPIVGDQVARYDESFNPRAFGDMMTRWGTSVVLIESGGELADPTKERLRHANFVAILTALDAIASRAWQAEGEERYLGLPLNAPWIHDLLVRGASIVLPGHEPVRADLAISFADSLLREAGRIDEVGDLQDAQALEQIDAAALFFLPDAEVLADGQLLPGATASGVLARDPGGREVVLRLVAGRVAGDR